MRQRRSDAARVVVYETDGINPYGIELARTVGQFLDHVTLVLPVDARRVQASASLSVNYRLPGNTPRSKGRQVLSLLRGLSVLGSALVRGEQVLVSWTRTSAEDLLLSVGARLGGKVALVQHNVDFRGTPSRLRRSSRASLLRSRATIITHAPTTAAALSERWGREVMVAEHPLYDWWVERYLTPLGKPPEDARFRVLMLGAMRPDKGLGELVEILALLPASLRERTVLRCSGPGVLAPDLVAILAAAGVALEQPAAPGFVPDEDVAEALWASALCAAPYLEVSQSGSVALALSAGLPVIAYDAGGLKDLMSPDFLVPSGDRAAFAKALTAAAAGALGTSALRIAPEAWRAEVSEGWRIALA